MQNKKLQLYKDLLEEALATLKKQADIEDCYDFDQEYVKEKEDLCITEFSARLAGLFRVTSDMIHKSRNIITVNENGVAEPAY
jgi:hypothetical protein